MSPAVWKRLPSCQKNDGFSLQLGGKLTHGRLPREPGGSLAALPVILGRSAMGKTGDRGHPGTGGASSWSLVAPPVDFGEE